MGLLHLYCGDGKGKTTAAVGLAVRMAGSGGRVLFVQFMKDGTSSELNILRTLPLVNCVTSRKHYGFYRSMTEAQKAECSEEYREMFASAARAFAQWDLVVFDELAAAYRHGLLDRATVLRELTQRPECTEVVLTGRDPAPELTALADYVSCVRKERHPFDTGVRARRGIEF